MTSANISAVSSIPQNIVDGFHLLETDRRPFVNIMASPAIASYNSYKHHINLSGVRFGGLRLTRFVA